MVYEIGNLLNIKSIIKNISGLKVVIYEIIELINGIAELRCNINVIKHCNSKVIIKPHLNARKDAINIEISISRDIEHNNILTKVGIYNNSNHCSLVLF